jgi:hypothetical protein
MAMPPKFSSGGNILGLNISAKPRPEFCIPVSIEIVLQLQALLPLLYW